MTKENPSFFISLLITLVSAFFLYQNYIGRRIRFTFRAGCYLWIVFFMGLSFMISNIWSGATSVAIPPTATPRLIARPATPIYKTPIPTNTTNPCTFWKNITRDDIGKNVCVYGNVYTQRLMPYGGSRIVFNREDSFYLVSPDFFFYDVKEGDCVTAEGEVEQSAEGLLYINIGSKLFICTSP